MQPDSASRTLRFLVLASSLAVLRATTEPLEEVECKYELQVEDYVDKEGTFKDEILYGKCTTAKGEVLYVPDEIQASQYSHGDQLLMLVKPQTQTKVASVDGASPDWAQAGNRLVDVVRTIKQTSLQTPLAVVRACVSSLLCNGSSEFRCRQLLPGLVYDELMTSRFAALQAPTAAAPLLRTVIVMRLIYKNASPSYCDGKCVMDGLFDGKTIGSGSVKGSVAVSATHITRRQQLTAAFFTL
eukprot:3882870-Pleurochrysis_carterae.AAC.6